MCQRPGQAICSPDGRSIKANGHFIKASDYRRKQAAEDSSGKGCSDLIASASRALQLERVQSKRLPRESCNCVGLSAKLCYARLGRSRALGLRKRSSRAELLCLRLPKAGKGPTAATTGP